MWKGRQMSYAMVSSTFPIGVFCCYGLYTGLAPPIEIMILADGSAFI